MASYRRNWRSLEGLSQAAVELLQGQLMEIFGKSKAVAAGLQGADGLLKCLLIVLADGH